MFLCQCFVGDEGELGENALEGEIAAGSLFKRRRRFHTWKKRWFVLKDGCLYYYNDALRKEVKACICLVGASCFESEIQQRGKYTFEISHRNYVDRVLGASSQRQMDLWMRSINNVIEDAKNQGGRDGFLKVKRLNNLGRPKWDQVWVVLFGGALRMYPDPNEMKAPLDTLNLKGCVVKRTINDAGVFAFELTAHYKEDKDSGAARMEFAADDYATRDVWISSLYKQSTLLQLRNLALKESDDASSDEDIAFAEILEKGEAMSPVKIHVLSPKDADVSKCMPPSPSPSPTRRRYKEQPEPLAGYLLKRSTGKEQAFHRRYFEVQAPGVLCYWVRKAEAAETIRPKGTIQLADMTDDSPSVGGEGTDLFFTIGLRSYMVRCSTPAEAEHWLVGLRAWANYAAANKA